MTDQGSDHDVHALLAEVERLRAVITQARVELSAAPDVIATQATRGEVTFIMMAQHAAWTTLADVPPSQRAEP